MGTKTQVTELANYAVHQVLDGWEIIAPSDDPYTPAYWRVAVVCQSGQHGWHDGPDRIDATVTPIVRCDRRQYRRIKGSLFAFCGPDVAEFRGVDFLLGGKTSPIVVLM
jgi:hypothetical protein